MRISKKIGHVLWLDCIFQCLQSSYSGLACRHVSNIQNGCRDTSGKVYAVVIDFCENSVSLNSYLNDAIRSEFCTWHSNSATMRCANLRLDWITKYYLKGLNIYLQSVDYELIYPLCNVPKVFIGNLGWQCPRSHTHQRGKPALHTGILNITQHSTAISYQHKEQWILYEAMVTQSIVMLS